MKQLWARLAAAKLAKLKIVTYAAAVPGGLVVRYATGIRERYRTDDVAGSRLRRLDRAGARLDLDIKPVRQFENDLLGVPFNHFALQRRLMRQASTLERLVALHRLVAIITHFGYVRAYPEAELRRELAAIATTPANDFFDRGTFVSHSWRLHHGLGRPILDHFFDRTQAAPAGRRSLAAAVADRRLVYRVLLDLARPFAPEGGRARLTTGAVLRGLNRWHGPPYRCPAAALALLRHTGAAGPLLALTPGHGQWALAAAVAGLPYLVEDEAAGAELVASGFADFCGLDWRVRGDAAPAWVVADETAAPADVLAWVGRAGRVLALLPRAAAGVCVPRPVAAWPARLHAGRAGAVCLW